MAVGVYFVVGVMGVMFVALSLVGFDQKSGNNR
jgi:hypothetical protein